MKFRRRNALKWACLAEHFLTPKKRFFFVKKGAKTASRLEENHWSKLQKKRIYSPRFINLGIWASEGQAKHSHKMDCDVSPRVQGPPPQQYTVKRALYFKSNVLALRDHLLLHSLQILPQRHTPLYTNTHPTTTKSPFSPSPFFCRSSPPLSLSLFYDIKICFVDSLFPPLLPASLLRKMGQESQDWSLELDSEGSDTPRSKESLGAHLANRLLSCPPGERRREEGTQRMSPVHAETRSTRNKRQQTASLSIASLLNSIIGEVGKTAANNAQLCLKLKDGNKVRLADALEALGDVCGDFEIRVPIHSLDVLPPELLGVCLSFLDLKAVLAAAQVCSLWGHLCNSLTIWRHLCRSTWPRYTEQAERAFQRRLKGIHQSPMVAVPSQAQVGGADSMWWKQAFFTKRNLESSWLEPREKRYGLKQFETLIGEKENRVGWTPK